MFCHSMRLFHPTVWWKYSLFLRFSPWRDPRPRYFSGYPFGASRKKASTFFYNTAFGKHSTGNAPVPMSLFLQITFIFCHQSILSRLTGTKSRIFHIPKRAKSGKTDMERHSILYSQKYFSIITSRIQNIRLPFHGVRTAFQKNFHFINDYCRMYIKRYLIPFIWFVWWSILSYLLWWSGVIDFIPLRTSVLKITTSVYACRKHWHPLGKRVLLFP